RLRPRRAGDAPLLREARRMVARHPAGAHPRARRRGRDRRREAQGDPLLPGRAARDPALVLPGALGREIRQRWRGLRRRRGAARVVQPGDQPADGHLDRPPRAARIRLEAGRRPGEEAMNLRSAVVTLCGMLLAAAAVLWLFDRGISGPWFRLGV